jgi:hypothetical protein
MCEVSRVGIRHQGGHATLRIVYRAVCEAKLLHETITTHLLQNITTVLLMDQGNASQLANRAIIL